jgi:hypothetical protein
MITIPYKFSPYPHQVELFKARDQGKLFLFTRWHRRAGKDKSFWNLMIREATKRVGQYYYLFPEYKQGRRVIWDGMDNDGLRFLDHIPAELLETSNSTEMKIRLSNNSIIQIIGTDDYDKIRGSNPVGMVFSEYAYQNPAAYDVSSPILLRNNGWAAFNSTPFGKNHMYDMEQMLLNDDEAFVQVCTIEDTVDFEGNPLITDSMLDRERKRGKSEEFLRQEYYCDYTANSVGFYYLSEMVALRDNNHIGSYPYNSEFPVETYWDIGVGDSTVIWFVQVYNNLIYLIDFYKNNSAGLEHYVHHLQNTGYIFSKHKFPHDMIQTEFGTGRTRFELAQNLLGSDKVELLPKLSFEDGIQASRLILPRCRFDEIKCNDGIKALENYHREWDPALNEFKNRPKHDWASHPADAFRYLATGLVFPKERAYRDSYIRQMKRMTNKPWMAA